MYIQVARLKNIFRVSYGPAAIVQKTPLTCLGSRVSIPVSAASSGFLYAIYTNRRHSVMCGVDNARLRVTAVRIDHDNGSRPNGNNFSDDSDLPFVPENLRIVSENNSFPSAPGGRV